MDWNEMIDAARAENAHGVSVRGGKKYTSVAVRVEIARRHLGEQIGIETEIVRYGAAKGEPVIIRAVIRALDGRVLATGTAEEIRGEGNVNRTSVVENAETSAIGRALAALGINGGEFASADEMTRAPHKSEAGDAIAAQAREDTDAAQLIAELEGFTDLDKMAAHWVSASRNGRAHLCKRPDVIAAKDAAKARLSTPVDASNPFDARIVDGD